MDQEVRAKDTKSLTHTYPTFAWNGWLIRMTDYKRIFSLLKNNLELSIFINRLIRVDANRGRKISSHEKKSKKRWVRKHHLDSATWQRSYCKKNIFFFNFKIKIDAIKSIFPFPYFTVNGEIAKLLIVMTLTASPYFTVESKIINSDDAYCFTLLHGGVCLLSS